MQDFQISLLLRVLFPFNLQILYSQMLNTSTSLFQNFQIALVVSLFLIPNQPTKATRWIARLNHLSLHHPTPNALVLCS